MMAEEYGAVRHVREINPFQQELEMFYLPACRVIGVEQTYGPKPCGDRAAAPQWQRVIASKEWKAIATLPLSNILRLGVVFVSIAWRNKRLFPLLKGEGWPSGRGGVERQSPATTCQATSPAAATAL